MKKVIAEPIDFPSTVPKGLHPTNQFVNEAYQFDPLIHLDYKPPQYIVDLDFKKIPINSLSKPTDFKGLAFTESFQLLSEEGIKVLRDIIKREEQNKAIAQSDHRTPLCLRGLGYVSPFIKDLNHSPVMNQLLSSLCQESIAPHTMPMNYSQINVGAIGSDRPVDQWHLDSVDYVLVIILSDVSEMEGGKLEVVMRDAKTSQLLLEEHKGKIPEELLMRAIYPKAGWAILMQGSKMMHRVSPVLKAKEPRMTLINSYTSLNVLRPDSTHYKTFSEGDPKHITPLEFARHKAWRSGALLKHILELPFPDPTTESIEKQNEEIVELLDQAISELTLTSGVLKGEIEDAIGYYDEVNQKQQKTIHLESQKKE